jgi:hypothetical protein
VLFLFSCGGGKQPETSQPITAANGGTVTLGNDIMVRVSPGALSADATIAISRAADKAAALPELEAAVPISSAYSIDIRGAELLKPIWVEVVFDPGRIPDDTPLELAFLARFDDASNRWVPLFGMVDPERHALVVETDHLSILQGWIPDVKALLRKMSDALVSLSLPTAEIPKCERRSPNYMSLDFNNLLLACIEEEEEGILGEAVLRIANNRAFAILIDPPDNVELLSPVSYGTIYDSVWSFLAEKVGGGLVYVPPAGNAEFVVRFSGPGDIRLSSEPSRLTLAADVFVVILKWLLRSYGIDPDASDFTRQSIHDLGVTILSMECLFKVGTATPTVRELVSTVVQCFPAMVMLPPKIDALAALVLRDLRIVVAVGQLAYEEFASGGRGLVTVSYQPPIAAKPCPVDDPSFCDFVYTVDDLLREGNAQGLGSLLALEDYECTEADTLGYSLAPPTDCRGKPVGTVVQVVRVGLCQSEGGLLNREEYLAYAVPRFHSVYAIIYPITFDRGGPGIVVTTNDSAFYAVLEVQRVGDRWAIEGSMGFRLRWAGSCVPLDRLIVWPGASACAFLMTGCAAKVSNVAPDGLNVREGPGTDMKVVGKLAEGTAVCIRGSAESFDWYPIRAPDGMEGWVSAGDPMDPATLWITPTGEVCPPMPSSGRPMYTREAVYYGNFSWKEDICKYSKDEIVERMRAAGASTQAITFFERTGFFLSERIEEHGLVDVGYGTGPCLANRNTRLFFLNGVPPEIAAYGIFPTGDWGKYPGYAELAGQNRRKLFLDSPRAVLKEAQTLPDGRQRMLIAAPIQECGACEPVVYMQMVVIFDSQGNIAEKEVLPPVPP